MKKLKKKICLILCLMIAAAGVLAGCGGSSGGTSGGSGGSDAVQSSNRADQTGGVQQVLEAGMQEAGEEAEAAPEEEPAVEEPEPETEAADEAGTAVSEYPETAAAATDVDVDLTVLSATMVYSEVFNMMTKPEEYIGKSIRMRGEFSYFLDESSGNEYFACIIRDATACCAQGIEFVLAGDNIYPDDYPEIGEEITVKGVFDVYTEGDSRYCTLRDAAME